MWAHPGKKLLFMGGELAQEREWSHDRELDWWILDHWEDHARLRRMLAAMNGIYRSHPALWEADVRPEGFEWIDANDSDQSVLSFLRFPLAGRPSRWRVACIANLTPLSRNGYRVGLPAPGRWLEVLNTDAAEWGGSGVGNSARWKRKTWLARPSLLRCHVTSPTRRALAGPA